MLLELIAEMLMLIGGLIVAYFVYVLITKRDDKPSTDSPTMAHTALRDIVERAVDEARKLPGLGGSGATGTPRQRRNIAEDSYEDVLASAILNKVIEKFRKERVDGNSNVLQGKPVSTSKYTLSESEAGLDEGVEEGCSSLEPLSQDDCCSDCSASGSRRIRNQPEPLSLTIEERIEEVTTTYTSDEEHKENDVLAVRNTHRVPFPELGMDIIDFSQESEDSQDEPDTPSTKIGLVTPIESWEENWLFQRKRVQSQPDPVAMLVPNPSADFKALIGDKDAEDTSDLSDCSSAQSDEEIEKELMEAINNVVPRSPKGKEHDNGLDSYQSAGSKDLSFAENDGERNVSESERTDDESSCGKLRDRSGVNGCEENDTGEACERNSQENHREPGEETEGKKIAGKLDPSRVQVENATAEAFKEEENARRRTNAEFGEHGTENTRRGRESFDQPRKNRSIENDSSKSNRSDQFSMLARDEENVQDVPRTPTSTPTRSSVTEIRPEDGNDERDVNVLNSLECAKKKLMAVNDDTAEVFITGEETGSGQQKADFHAEDIQQESEYTEHYDIATQRHLDSLTKTEWVEPADDKESKCREAAAQAKAVSASHVSLPTKKSEEDVRLATPPRPGSIAEREHKKWENAPPIENNPYSQENIQKRLWERQYSRRPSDIPGNHNELPKSNGEDLDAMLAAHEPDIKRFGRDYYINESKASGNERGRRSAASSTSRPSSSLSQRSSSTGIGDQDPQVSYRLEKFEEASLRGSLSRWTYRDPCSSPHFAINPLLRMELDETTDADNVHESRALEPVHDESLANERNDTRHESNGVSSCGVAEVKADDEFEYFNVRTIRDESDEIRLNVSKGTQLDELLSNRGTRKLSYNPLYEAEDRVKRDRDSGMYSMDTNEQITDVPGERRRLWMNEWRNVAGRDQILSANGKRYLNLDRLSKYHTFGGIKSSAAEYAEDSEDEPERDEAPGSFDIAEFANFEFQTFGGIKRDRKPDGKPKINIPTYRRVTLRSVPRNGRNPKVSRSSRSDSFPRNRSGNDSCPAAFARANPEENDEDRSKESNFHSSSYLSFCEDDWQDEDVRIPDREIMRKFLKDASKRAKSRSSNDDSTSTYYLNTSIRKKLFDDARKRGKLSQRQRTVDDNDSLKLEAPIVPEVVEKTYESLRDLRSKGKRKKREIAEPSGRKPGMRYLSDLTIW